MAITGLLPAVAPIPQPQQQAQTINQLIKENNRQDAFKAIYAADTGTSTAYAITPVPGIKFYRVGQIFVFKALHANTGATPTLNVNGWGAGTITKQGGAALAVGDIALGDFVTVICTSTTPTFQVVSQVATPAVLTGATTFLGANVALNNVANFFNGPNTGSIGANGQTWLIMAVANLADGANAAHLEAAIFNGTSYIAADEATSGGAGFTVTITLMSVAALTGATTFTLRAKDQTSVNGILETTGNATAIANTATSITAVRLA